MKPSRYFLIRVIPVSLLLLMMSVSLSTWANKKDDRVTRRIEKQLKQWENPLLGWRHVGKIAIDSVSVLPSEKRVKLFFSRALSYLPLREDNSGLLETSVRACLDRRYRDFQIDMFTDGHPVQNLIPNVYRKEGKTDDGRFTLSRKDERIPLVKQSGSEMFKEGLYNNNIALWNSHGWYFESKLDRWEWQRPRLFGTAEDIFTKGFVMPFLVPMLENSGATVLVPTERDVNKKEYIVDNDYSFSGGKIELPAGWTYESIGSGFKWKDTLYSGENPFTMGTSLLFSCQSGKTGEVAFIPPSMSGDYAVYVSWLRFENSCKSVKYTVHASGGDHEFLVNQQIGGGTWIYLGTFRFDQDHTAAQVSQYVSLSLSGNNGEVISADAVRFGGGMGNVARRPADVVLPNVKSVDDSPANSATAIKVSTDHFSWKVSGKSRYREGARYFLQYAGFPDSLVYNLNHDRNDYNDDYMSRGEWVNYLMGAPNGPQKNRLDHGLRIPVDLSMAFHSDAGITPGDSIIGTLGIYSTWADNGRFPDGTTRMASRDLADMIQTQIVEDIRSLQNDNWTRRGLWDRQYSEAWRPNVPTMLLELLSHQNLADMKYGLDPRFRFSVSRAIYKGMLKFLASRENRPFIVHPLPVSHFALRIEGASVRLSWKPVADPLEPSASPARYKVYRRTGSQGFDMGTIVSDTTLLIPLDKEGLCYSFKVTALNDGGESFPSEILSVGLAPGSKGSVLVVNVFDRVSGPAVFDTGRKAGVEWWHDQGVAWNFHATASGNQYDYDRKSDWTDDDNPGWGSSFADMEDAVVPGNTFDFTVDHGAAILESGYSFVSASDEAFCLPGFPVKEFFAVDLLLGEEKAIPSLKDSSAVDFRIYTPEMMEKLREVVSSNGNILISGAYAGSDFFEVRDTTAASFARKTLHFIRRTGHASVTGHFYSADYGKKWFNLNGHFNTDYTPDIYQVEAPDGLEPSGENAFTIFRYRENNVSAGVAYRGSYKSVVLGFPIETITTREVKNNMVKQVLLFFESKP